MGFLAVVTNLTVFIFRATGRASTVLPVFLLVQVRREGSSAAPEESAQQREDPIMNVDANKIHQDENFIHIMLIYYFLSSMSRS